MTRRFWLVMAAALVFVAWAAVEQGFSTAWARGVDEPESVGASDPFGEWRGHYLCPQGITGLTLTVRKSENAEAGIAALFDFYPLSDNPTQTGQFTMLGTWDQDGQRLELSPETWIEQPEGWFMVGLDLRPSQDFGLMTGIVTNHSCGPVFLEREGINRL